LALVGAAAALVGAKVALVQTAPATDGSASVPAETKVVPVGKFAVLKPGERAAVFQAADAEAAPVEEPSAHKLEGASAASARFKTAPGDGSAARMPDGAVAAFADTAAVPVEGFTVLENAVEETAASATGGAALVCHVEHAVMACEEMWVELYDKSHGCALLRSKSPRCLNQDRPV